MANKQDEQIEQPEKVEKIKEEKKPKVYKIIKNVKFGEDILKIGNKVEIPDEDLQEFKDAKAIKIDD